MSGLDDKTPTTEGATDDNQTANNHSADKGDGDKSGSAKPTHRNESATGGNQHDHQDKASGKPGKEEGSLSIETLGETQPPDTKKQEQLRKDGHSKSMNIPEKNKSEKNKKLGIVGRSRSLTHPGEAQPKDTRHKQSDSPDGGSNVICNNLEAPDIDAALTSHSGNLDKQHGSSQLHTLDNTAKSANQGLPDDNEEWVIPEAPEAGDPSTAKELQRLKKDLEQVKNDIAQKEREVQKDMHLLENSRKDVEQKDEKLKSLTESLNQALDDRSQKEEEVKKLKIELKQSENNAKHKQAEYERLQTENKRFIEEMCTTTQKENDKYAHDCTQAKQERDQARLDIDRLVAEKIDRQQRFEKEKLKLKDKKAENRRKFEAELKKEKDTFKNLEQRQKEKILENEKASNQRICVVEREKEEWRNKCSSWKENSDYYQSECNKLYQQNQQHTHTIETLKGQVRDLHKQNCELDKERSTLVLRLSKIAGAKLTTNNANIADLSDENRPTKLAEKFSELYDNEWTDAFEEVTITMDEETGVQYMLQLLQRAFVLCTDMANGHIESMKESAMTVKYTTIKQMCSTAHTTDAQDFSKTTDMHVPSGGNGAKEGSASATVTQGSSGDNSEHEDSSKTTDMHVPSGDNGEQEDPNGENSGNPVTREGGNSDELDPEHTEEVPMDVDNNDTENGKSKLVEDETLNNPGQHNMDVDNGKAEQTGGAFEKAKHGTGFDTEKAETTPETFEKAQHGTGVGTEKAETTPETFEKQSQHSTDVDTGKAEPTPETSEKSMHDTDVDIGNVEPKKDTFEKIIHTITAPDGLPAEFLKQIMDMRKYIGLQMETLVTEKITETIAEEFTIRQDQKPLAFTYIRKSVQLCWSMGLKDPPVYMNIEPPGDHTKFDTDVYKAYTKTGKVLRYVVWPALYLHKGGPLLSKGVAQGEGGK